MKHLTCKPPLFKSLESIDWVFIILVLPLGAYLRLKSLDFQSLWFDEVFLIGQSDINYTFLEVIK